MDTICFIHLPTDFNERYRNYREMLLEDEPQKTDPKEVEKSLVLADANPKNDEVAEMKTGEKRENDAVIFDVPLGTAWSEITIKFKDEQTVEAHKGMKYLGAADFKRMGLGKIKPDQRWKMLHRLAVIYVTNPNKNPSVMPATIDDIAYSLLDGVSKQKRQQVQTLKTQLSSQLRTSFGIDDEPFEDYDQWRYYKTKFELKPEPDLRNEVPYESAKQLHGGVERLGSDDPHLEKLGSRRLSDEENVDGFESEDDEGSRNLGDEDM